MACDRRCWYAKGKRCTCSECQGLNHGKMSIPPGLRGKKKREEEDQLTLFPLDEKAKA
jgi:hypothetical protein